MKSIKGIIPPIITPLLENEEVDEESLRNIVSSCVENGLHGIFVAGSGGETMALTQKQRDRAIQIVLHEANGCIPVLCGAMDTSTFKVIENIKQIEQQGGKVAVVTPVFYTRTTSQDDIVRHFEEISRHTDMDIMIYNIPVNTHIHITAEAIRRIRKIDKVVGLKDSSGNFAHFQECLFSCQSQKFGIFQGATDIAGISLIYGSDGFIPIYSIFFPKVYKRLYESAVSGDIAQTMRIQQIVNRISDTITIRGHTVFGAKAIASAFGMGSSRLCEPYVKLPKSDYDRLQQLALHYSRTIQQAQDFTDPEVWAEMFGKEASIAS